MASIYYRFESFVDRFTRKRFWKVYLAILCSIYCVVTNIPQYKTLVHGEGRGKSIWHRINRQIDHPFTADTSNDPESHEARLTFRLTAPLIGKLLPVKDENQRMTGLFIIQNVLGILFFYLLILFGEKNFNNKPLTFLLPWCFAVLYAGKTFFSDTIFFFDGIAFFFLLASVCTRKPLLVFISLLLAFYTDERALIGSGFVMLYHVMQNKENGRHKAAIVGIIAAIIVSIGLRFFLQKNFGMTVPSGDINFFTNIGRHTYFGFVLLGIFIAFKSFWAIFLIGAFYVRGFWPRVIYLGTLLAIIAGGISVFDFSRSISYGLVGLLAVLMYLSRQPNWIISLNKLMLVLFFTSFINPIYDVHRHEVFLTRSIFSVYFEKKYEPMPADKNFYANPNN